ncbi:uncharacterized protein LOC105849214 isoform X1 [Hydra vulgaris]|uniref:uncharacterized protein LOC105849214 isoform X1 n=1 Tax=Hydra vulgaris TaxID=6087 RepID=UPI001F5FCF23|nr:uncharacterized protein LOC105849214 [Hydra vulgaris]
MIRKHNFFQNFLYLMSVFFISYGEFKFLSFVNRVDEKSKITFLSMRRITETRLVSNAILLNMSASHQSLCMNRCIKTTNCTSYNIFKNNESLFQCQLLSENKYSNSNQLEKNNGWTHASIQNIPCERSPCKNNSTCIPDYAENSFFCICSPTYIGPFCEKELFKIISLPLNNLGCWKDELNSAMTTLEGSSTILDGFYRNRADAIKKCYEAAKERGFTIFDVRDGGYCSACNDGAYRKGGLSNLCNENGKGNVMSNQAYIITEKLLYKYAGCWKDSSSRALTLLEGSTAVLDNFYQYRVKAIAKCYIAATERNYELFAVQHDGQCFAGNGVSYQKYGIANNCNRNGEGGGYANAVYIVNFD